MRGKKLSKEWVEKLRKATLARWRDEDKREKILKALNFKPNLAEKHLKRILDYNFPNEWKYVGDFSFLINFKNPDFVNINGKRTCIELYAPYFKIVGWGSCEEYEKQREMHFSKQGWKTIFIKSNELKDELKLVAKIKRM